MSNSALPVRLVSSASRVLNSALISAGCSSRARIGIAAAPAASIAVAELCALAESE
jgi:hypothetical protein